MGASMMEPSARALRRSILRREIVLMGFMTSAPQVLPMTTRASLVSIYRTGKETCK